MGSLANGKTFSVRFLVDGEPLHFSVDVDLEQDFTEAEVAKMVGRMAGNLAIECKSKAA